MVLVSLASMQNVAILIWDGVELLDFAGPGEVFSSARDKNGKAAFRVYTVASSEQPILSQGFLTVTPQFTIDNCPEPDIVVLPGGGVGGARRDEDLMNWIAGTEGSASVHLSVCTGAYILAELGWLDGKEATTHWSAIRGLRELASETKVVENVRFVDQGAVITSAGVSAGIDSSLHLVARLLGHESAKKTARYMEYLWKPGTKASGN